MDETLATSGITHLIEHLALHPFGANDSKHANGYTEPLTTTFVIRGSADEIVSFFHIVTAGLRELPSERIEREKRVLRAEGADSRLGKSEVILRHRYGAEGFGLLSFPEMGLEAAGPGELAAWVKRGFTRGNAALWLAGGPRRPSFGWISLTASGRRFPPCPTPSGRVPRISNANAAGPGFCGLVRLGRVLKEPLAATAVTLVFVVGLPLLIGQFSATAGVVAGAVMLLTVFTSLSIMRELRARLWLAAAKRAGSVEPPPDFG